MSYFKVSHEILITTVITSVTIIMSSMISYFFITSYRNKTEQRIQELFQRVLNNSPFSRFDITDSAHFIEVSNDPSVGINTCETNHTHLGDEYLNYLHRLLTLYDIIAEIFRIFPSTNHVFSDVKRMSDKIGYAVDVETLQNREIFALFEHVLERESDNDIKKQLNILVRALKINRTDGQPVRVLQKLEYLIELANSTMGQRELLIDILLLTILIKSSERSN